MKKIDTTQWKEFNIVSLFDVVLSKGDIQARKMQEGEIPLVSSGKFNNGICKYIADGDGIAEIFSGNVITIDMFGKSYYQAQSFYAVSHGRVNVLLPRFELTPHIAKFIVSVLDASYLNKYSFTGMCNQTQLNNETITLPVSSDGQPDWEYMEQYMQQIENNVRSSISLVINLL